VADQEADRDVPHDVHDPNPGRGAEQPRPGNPADSDAQTGEIVAGLTLEQKAALCLGSDFWHTAPVPEQQIPSILFSDGPHGLRTQAADAATADTDADPGDIVPATCFPTASALGSSWDRTLCAEVGAALGQEARRAGVAVVLGPGLNMKRNPLCGRNFEYFSEDPVHTGELATAMVNGIQSRGVGASVKHFAANNQETDRMRISAEVDQRSLREIYLPAFERVIAGARPWTVMCSYNRINGCYASQHHWLLDDLLRTDWGFTGLVVSDWGAVHDRVAALRAGLDLEMPPALGHSDVAIMQAIRSGELDEATLDRSVTRLLDLVRTAQQAPDVHTGGTDPEHHQLARRAASQCAVLVKNDGPLLPLDPRATMKIAVIGELAQQPRFQGSGSSRVNATSVDIPLTEMMALAGPDVAIDFAPGYSLDKSAADEGLRNEAVAAALEADVVVVFLGLDAAAESEGFDREHMNLPGNQTELMAALGETGRRLAAVLMNGSAVVVEDWQHHADAILECWLGGQAVGGAIADLIFGRENPGGKLAETIPKRLADTPSYLNFPGEAGTVRYGEGVFIGYRGYDELDLQVSYPFGHGLSYTDFWIDDPEIAVTGSVAGNDLNVVVTTTVSNTGDRAGAEVVQLYVADPVSDVARPIRELKDFAKLYLQPGQRQTVSFQLGTRAFAYWSQRLAGWVVEAGEFRISVGFSSRNLAPAQSIFLDAPRSQPPLTAASTLNEWLEDPDGRNILESDPGAAEGLHGMDDETLMMAGSMPMSTLASFGQMRFGHQDLDRLVGQLDGRPADRSSQE
jgi:beta-glucosidase